MRPKDFRLFIVVRSFLRHLPVEEIRVWTLSILWSTLFIAETAYLTVLRNAPGVFLKACNKTNTLLDVIPYLLRS